MTVEQPCEKLQHDVVERVHVHLRGELIGPEEDEVHVPHGAHGPGPPPDSPLLIRQRLHSRHRKRQILTTHYPISSARSRPRADHVTGEVTEGTRSLLDPPHHDRGVEQQQQQRGPCATASTRCPRRNSWWKVNTAGQLTCWSSTGLDFGLMPLHLWRRR
jgi:hypothetical protein